MVFITSYCSSHPLSWNKTNLHRERELKCDVQMPKIDNDKQHEQMKRMSKKPETYWWQTDHGKIRQASISQEAWHLPPKSCPLSIHPGRLAVPGDYQIQWQHGCPGNEPQSYLPDFPTHHNAQLGNYEIPDNPGWDKEVNKTPILWWLSKQTGSHSHTEVWMELKLPKRKYTLWLYKNSKSGQSSVISVDKGRKSTKLKSLILAPH